jgi:phage-related protein
VLNQPRLQLEPVLLVFFYRSNTNKEPVRDWLKAQSQENRRIIGEDMKTVQFAYPIEMPLVRKLEPDWWEVRSHIQVGIARTIFTVQNNQMILLHTFIKKSQKTPKSDLELARKRLKELLENP